MTEDVEDIKHKERRGNYSISRSTSWKLVFFRSSVKFREHLKNVHGLDIVQSLPQINELVVNWEE